jgi:hypothetical protein
MCLIAFLRVRVAVASFAKLAGVSAAGLSFLHVLDALHLIANRLAPKSMLTDLPIPTSSTKGDCGLFRGSDWNSADNGHASAVAAFQARVTDLTSWVVA